MEETDYVDSSERMQEAERISEELRQISTNEIPRTRNLEYMVLKCHLIIEFALTQYIRFMSEPVIDAKDIRFTFAQKLNVAYMMGFGIVNPTLIPSLELLNKARNQVAHSFELNVSLVNELIRINSDDYELLTAPSLTEQLGGLRHITQYVCGTTSGYIAVRGHLDGRR